MVDEGAEGMGGQKQTRLKHVWGVGKEDREKFVAKILFFALIGLHSAVLCH